MPSSNFNNDKKDGVVVADGFSVKTPAGAQVQVISSAGAAFVDTITFVPGLVGIPTYQIDDVSVGLPAYTVAAANALSPMPAEGSLIYVTNGNAGAACLAVRSGGAWLRIALGAAISAT